MVVRSEGWLYFCNDCKSDSIRCNGRGKQGKDALSVCAQGLCKDAKPTKHTQTLALRKERDSADAKQMERSFKGKSVGTGREGVVLLRRLWGLRGWWV